MDWLTLLRSTITVMTFAGFIGIAWWAYSARRRPSFEAAARLALEDERSPQEWTRAGKAPQEDRR